MQQEYGGVGNQSSLDISKIIDNSIRFIKHYWFQVILFIAIVVSGYLCYTNINYNTSYTSQITYAVQKTDSTTIDSDIAKRLSTSLGQLNEMPEFKNELMRGIKVETRNPNFTISSSFTEDITLYTVSITAGRYENANLLLDRFKEIYPIWAAKSIGAVDLQIVGINYCSESSGGQYSLASVIINGLLIALALCAIMIYIYTQMVKTVHKERDMRSIGVRNCITVVPEVKFKKRNLMKRNQLFIANNRVDWGFKQAMLAAQSRIENQMMAEGKKVMVVTSTVPQEGKSSVIVNLAIAFAQKGHKVLLLDGDFRKPSLAKAFGIEEKPGLTDCFVDVVHPSKLIQTIEGVDYISAGTYEGAVSGILNHRIMKVLMKRWREYYDFILIDTPPSLYTDATIFAGYADSVLYVVRYDTCDIKEIKEGISRYIAKNKLIGYILNRNPGGFSTYGRYGRYGRYGHYGKYGKYGHYSRYNRYIRADLEATEKAEQPDINPAEAIKNKVSTKNTFKEVEQHEMEVKAKGVVAEAKEEKTPEGKDGKKPIVMNTEDTL